MRRIKKTLLGIALCGAMALAGGVVAMNMQADETISAVAQEANFTAVKTGITKIHLRDKRLLLFLDSCDYSKTGGTTAAGGKYAEYNTMEKIQVYTGDTCVSLADAMAKNAASYDLNVYYNVWSETNSVSYQFDGDMYTASNVTKIVVPAGTQFPSYSYTNASGEAVAYTTDVTYVFTNNDMAKPDWSTNWSVTVEVPTVDYENVTETAVTGAYVRNGALEFALSKNDYSTVGGSVTPGAKYATYNFLDKVIIYDAEGNSATWKEAFQASKSNKSNPLGCWYNLWTSPNRIAFELSEEWQGKIAKVFIPAGTQFPSAAYTNGSGEALAYEVKQDTYFVGSGESWQVDYTSLSFKDTDTSISLVQWVNEQRLMIWLSENDYGTAAENKVNVNVPAAKLSATNMLDKILVNGKSLKSLGVTTADLNYWTYWSRVSVALTGVTVESITIQEDCQFPSMAFAESGTPNRFVNKQSVTYYAVGTPVDSVLTCKKGASVTFDGESVTAYVGEPIPADVIPANPTKEGETGYYFEFDGWYNGENKWDMANAIVTGDMSLVSKFTKVAYKYTLSMRVENETTTQEVAYGAGILLYAPEVAGKTFVRWYMLDEKNNVVDVPATMPAEDISIYAEMRLNTYTITFVGCDGVEPITFTVETMSEVVFPEVPAKDGFTAVWDKSEEDLTLADLTVTAIYTEIPVEPDTSDSTSDVTSDTASDSTSDTTSDTTSDSTNDGSEDLAKPTPAKKGCGAVASVTGVASVLALVGTALLLNKKED